MYNILIDIFATFGALFAYYDSPLFTTLRRKLSFITRPQLFFIVSLFFVLTTLINFNYLDYLVAVSAGVLFINGFVNYFRLRRRG